MQLKHILCGVLIAVIWGCNFIFIRIGLEEIPPLALGAIRFFLSSIPLVFFVKRPAISWKWLLTYSFTTFALQFACLFLGMKAGLTPGLASLLSQIQVFFSFLFAAIFLGERLTRWQIIGAFFAFTGVAVVLEHLDGGDITFVGFAWILAASMVWGMGNSCVKKMGKTQGLSLVVWSSFLAVPPLFLASYIVDGPTAIFTSLHALPWRGFLSVFYIAYLSTWVGYGLWAWLLSVYTVGMVVPFTLLVPVVGMLASSFIIGEGLQTWKLIAAGFILFGLMVHLFGARLPRLFKFRLRGQQNL
ncbi:MAG: EamA family transporter [Gammaproteobacteria bacterium]|nr:EamA family transporter [Gammaproteobacteria bacterium]